MRARTLKAASIPASSRREVSIQTSPRLDRCDSGQLPGWRQQFLVLLFILPASALFLKHIFPEGCPMRPRTGYAPSSTDNGSLDGGLNRGPG